ncbi:uroporphyrinogen-III synthase [Novosphingobium sp. KN65.2]|uniref:uroporphyrinogen-III synthase n=1 Tax=Novosphingobium sp. KN65.2 TaxID=1478134 RepID=UPI0005E6543C|nr:uroporphyrinogen-III synthase [Novosphingobium sp. KN65.2]CDO35603.1 Uroporphyrinogen-III synthase [Novosphingobium sp. KN65.2]
MTPLVIIRPEPGAGATEVAAHALGLDARCYPLFAVRPLAWEPVPASEIDAILLGSANALRHGGAALEAYRGHPAYAVGEKTAAAARAAGLDVVATGKGGLQRVLANLAPAHRRLLRLAGRERVALSLPPGVTMTTREVYASEVLPLPADLKHLLSAPCVVLLHSGEAAAHFAQSVEASGIDRRHVSLAAIGPRVAARAGDGWAALRSADEPSDAALLVLASQMCQDTANRVP